MRNFAFEIFNWIRSHKKELYNVEEQAELANLDFGRKIQYADLIKSFAYFEKNNRGHQSWLREPNGKFGKFEGPGEYCNYNSVLSRAVSLLCEFAPFSNYLEVPLWVSFKKLPLTEPAAKKALIQMLLHRKLCSLSPNLKLKTYGAPGISDPDLAYFRDEDLQSDGTFTVKFTLKLGRSFRSHTFSRKLDITGTSNIEEALIMVEMAWRELRTFTKVLISDTTNWPSDEQRAAEELEDARNAAKDIVRNLSAERRALMKKYPEILKEALNR